MDKIDFKSNPLYAGTYIRTYSGIYINVFDINKQKHNIRILDIAHGLSRICRFTGHVHKFYSVAQHSLYVASLLPDELKLEGLLHDASETYIIDIPGPIKPMLGDYKKIENDIMAAIAKKYKMQYPFDTRIKEADKKALEYEWENAVINDNLDFVDMDSVEKEFLSKFYEYSSYGKR